VEGRGAAPCPIGGAAKPSAGSTAFAITIQTYIDQILKPIIKPWIERGDRFILEEDGVAGHGKTKNQNIIQR
jgi:hypothetical protein